MNVLLDTHAFIWYSISADKLSKNALDAINTHENRVFLSQVSIWEMQIKHDLGKLHLPKDVKSVVEDQFSSNAIDLLQIKNEHLWLLSDLPKVHNDPFDRLLICQALLDNLAFITCDPKIHRYAVEVIW